jgi:hypothetical protein
MIKSANPQWFMNRNIFRHLFPLQFFLIATLLSSTSLKAGTFFSDFNSGQPTGTAVFGNTKVQATGGYTNSGVLALTTNGASLTAGFVITNDIDAGAPVVSFTATFKAFIGGGSAADGFSFNFAPDLPFGIISEEGAGTGLSVSVDTFSNANDHVGIDIKAFGNEIAPLPLPLSTVRPGTFVDVFIQLAPDNTVQVFYDGTYVSTNVFAGVSPITAGYFGFGARTGGQNDNHFIDNLNIITRTNASPYVDYYFPIGRNVRADAPLNVELTDYVTQVDPTTIVLKLDGSTVVPTIAQAGGKTTLSYTPPGLFVSNSTHTVSLVFADNATPTPNTNALQYSFTAAPYATLPVSLAASPSLVSANPGFNTRVSQIDVNLGPTLQRAENQLANLLIDASTSLPYVNLATPNPDNSSFNYTLTNTINMSVFGNQGNFPTDDLMPGLPGTTGGTTNVAMDAVAYLHLNAGSLYTLGVNCSDGFRLTASSNPDRFSPVEVQFDGVRAAADSTVTFACAQTGYYPFRILYLVGGLETVNPTGNNPSLEFFNIGANGIPILINDTNTPGYVPAFRPAATLPYVRSVSPNDGDTAVPRTTAIDVALVDGSITVQTNTIQLQLAGVVVTPTITTNGLGVTLVHYQSGSSLAVNSNYLAQIAFTDSASTRRTNTWHFTTENILSQLFVIPPASATNATWAKWVTSAGTERGIAYNPKTGHVLLVSRNSATGADGPAGGGIAVLDGTTGLYIKQLDKGTGIITGGTFALNMIDVADDGVIYVCNLATSAAQNFRIYRWQDENSQPTIAYSLPPSAAAGTPRWGDDFAVRRSGAGTQIIASGNNTSANSVPVLTTPDGTNFILTLLVPTSLPNNSVRLGIAWGCGNTFYGETTGAGNDLRFVTFNGPPSTAGSLTTSYRIVDALSSQFIGPIGVDLKNQRVIGASTTGGTTPHSMNLYDLNSLAVSPTINTPIDSKPFAVNVGTFGTGSVDFTPDGSRVYTLDSGSGIIAFSLTPKLAAPTICSQPQNFIATNGSVGFFGVGAIGSPQTYQWRFHGTNAASGTNIVGATNGTLDIYYVQQSGLGFYSVVITNPLGSVTSSVVYLDTPLTVTNPTDAIIAIGGTTNFNVGVAGGLAPISYQWKLNGNNIAGATGTSLTIANAQITDGGAYTVVITDVLGQTTTSAIAGLTVGNAGTGIGLNGDYYSSQLATFLNAPTLTRIDPTINFDFGTGSPDPSISADTFTVRWNGQVQPFYSQTYTFYTTTDDGVRLWVNGQRLVNSWANQAPTERSGTIALTAGQKYDILMEYFENTGGAVAKLSWSSPNQFKQIIPQTQLYPGTTPVIPVLGVTPGSNSITFNWSGTFQLMSSTNVEGPYLPVPNATNGPIVITPSQPAEFFRLLNQD